MRVQLQENVYAMVNVVVGGASLKVDFFSPSACYATVFVHVPQETDENAIARKAVESALTKMAATSQMEILPF